ITGRRESELNRRRLAAVLEGSADVIFFTDPQGQVLYLNRKGCELFEQKRHPSHLTIYDLSAPTEQARLREVAVPTARSKGFWRGETRILSARGEEIPVSLMVEAQLTSDEIGRASCRERDTTQLLARPASITTMITHTR